MRPQHITAENLAHRHRADGGILSFNEAAAYHCGKHTRPPASCVLSGCFNEAAAYHCGKHALSGVGGFVDEGLQ